jgi:hypothetical protein
MKMSEGALTGGDIAPDLPPRFSGYIREADKWTKSGLNGVGF